MSKLFASIVSRPNISQDHYIPSKNMISRDYIPSKNGKFHFLPENSGTYLYSQLYI